jgi:hypothetical protein
MVRHRRALGGPQRALEPGVDRSLDARQVVGVEARQRGDRVGALRLEQLRVTLGREQTAAASRSGRAATGRGSAARAAGPGARDAREELGVGGVDLLGRACQRRRLTCARRGARAARRSSASRSARPLRRAEASRQPARVRARAQTVGARVTGIGEAPVRGARRRAPHWLDGYEQVPRHRRGALLDAVRSGAGAGWVDRLEATVEAHILPAAKVREACGIPGTSVRTAFSAATSRR